MENQWFRIPEDIFIRNKLNNPFKPKPLGTAFNRANKRAGFKKLDNTTAIPKIDYIRLHILRKIFASTLGKNKMPHLMTRELLGHAIDPITSKTHCKR